MSYSEQIEIWNLRDGRYWDNREILRLQKELASEKDISLALGLEYYWVEEILERELPQRDPTMSQADCLEAIINALRYEERPGCPT